MHLELGGRCSLSRLDGSTPEGDLQCAMVEQMPVEVADSHLRVSVLTRLETGQRSSLGPKSFCAHALTNQFHATKASIERIETLKTL